MLCSGRRNLFLRLCLGRLTTGWINLCFPVAEAVPFVKVHARAAGKVETGARLAPVKLGTVVRMAEEAILGAGDARTRTGLLLRLQITGRRLFTGLCGWGC